MDPQTPQDYFELIYRATCRRLSQHVFLRAAGTAEAEDVVAAVYMDFYRYVVLPGKRPGNALAYLTRMADHELGRLYAARTPQLSFDDEDLNLSETIPDSADLELAVFDQFAAEALWQAVGRLSQAEQQVLIARVRFEMTFPEIASSLQTSENTIKARYYRAIAKLRQILADQSPD